MAIIIVKCATNRFNKVSLYLDFDGVVLDTNRYTRNELLRQYGIDKWTHKRSNIEDDKKVAQFFKDFNWVNHIEKIPQINDSLHTMEALRDCGIFNGPCIFTNCASSNEAKVKKEFLFDKISGIDMIYQTDTRATKKIPLEWRYDFISNSHPALVDDDPHNLDDWRGYAIPFNGGNPNYNFPAMESLDELFEMFARLNSKGEKYIPIYDDGRFSQNDIIGDFDFDSETGYVVTDKMQKNLVLRKNKL